MLVTCIKQIEGTSELYELVETIALTFVSSRAGRDANSDRSSQRQLRLLAGSTKKNVFPRVNISGWGCFFKTGMLAVCHRNDNYTQKAQARMFRARIGAGKSLAKGSFFRRERLRLL